MAAISKQDIIELMIIAAIFDIGVYFLSTDGVFLKILDNNISLAIISISGMFLIMWYFPLTAFMIYMKEKKNDVV